MCFQKKETITNACTAVVLVNLNLSVFSPFCQPCSSFPAGPGMVLYSCPLCLLKHPAYLAVHSHHKSRPQLLALHISDFRTTLQRQATARENMGHSLKVLWCLSYRAAQFSLDTKDVVRDESSLKCPLKNCHNNICCLTLTIVNNSSP